MDLENIPRETLDEIEKELEHRLSQSYVNMKKQYRLMLRVIKALKN